MRRSIEERNPLASVPEIPHETRVQRPDDQNPITRVRDAETQRVDDGSRPVDDRDLIEVYLLPWVEVPVDKFCEGVSEGERAVGTVAVGQHFPLVSFDLSLCSIDIQLKVMKKVVVGGTFGSHLNMVGEVFRDLLVPLQIHKNKSARSPSPKGK